MILGTLKLNQDLELKQDYYLQINEIDDSTSGEVKKSDGTLTVTNNATLTATNGSSITATKLVIDTGTVVVQTSDIPNEILYSDSGILSIQANITSDIDFAGNNGVLQLADSQTITGKVDSSTVSAGTLEFLGKGIVTGTIGETNPLTSIKVSGAGDITIPAANAKTIEVANAGANVDIIDTLEGNVVYNAAGTLMAQKGIIGDVIFNDAGTLTTNKISGSIDCVDQAATINFSGNSDYILEYPIQNGKNATLSINIPKLTVPSLEIGNINISDNKVLAINLAAGDETLLAPGGDGIKFLGHNSTFQIENTNINEERVASLAANLAGEADAAGILLLSGGAMGLVITGDTAPTTIGTPNNEINMLEAQGMVTMRNSIDASSVFTLNVVAGASFTDQSCTTTQIPIINIGSPAPTAYLGRLHEARVVNDLVIAQSPLIKAGSVHVSPPSSIYAIDVSNITNGNLDLLTLGHTINFIDANSTLKLLNMAASDHSITLLRDLDPGQDNWLCRIYK